MRREKKNDIAANVPREYRNDRHVLCMSACAWPIISSRTTRAILPSQLLSIVAFFLEAGRIRELSKDLTLDVQIDLMNSFYLFFSITKEKTKFIYLILPKMDPGNFLNFKPNVRLFKTLSIARCHRDVSRRNCTAISFALINRPW